MIFDKKNATALIKDFEKYTGSLNGGVPEWFNKSRREGLKRFEEQGLPTTKHEEWKYTDIKPIVKHSFSFARPEKPLDRAAFKKYISQNDINIVLVNGVLSEELSDIAKLPKGVSIAALPEALKSRGDKIKSVIDRFTPDLETPFMALNQALSKDGLFVEIAAGTVSERLIHILHITSIEKGKPAFAAPRTIIAAGKSSETTILESHVAFDDASTYFVNALTEADLEENAVLHYCKAQSESKNAYHIGATRVYQERNSNFDSFSMMTGGDITRNNIEIIVDGEGCNSTINGLYSLGDKQLADNHSAVDHRQPNCTSTQLYKGILTGDSHTVFNGKIFVQPVAQQTNSYQLNKTLTLGEKCRVDTKPQLEIFADDVKCTHGATVGQLNEDELFYLQTRCIPRRKAVAMLAHGFVDDILESIKHPSIVEKLNTLLIPTFERLE